MQVQKKPPQLETWYSDDFLPFNDENPISSSSDAEYFVESDGSQSSSQCPSPSSSSSFSSVTTIDGLDFQNEAKEGAAINSGGDSKLKKSFEKGQSSAAGSCEQISSPEQTGDMPMADDAGRGDDSSDNGNNSDGGSDQDNQAPGVFSRRKKTPSRNEDQNLACPFRKRNPMRFNIRDRPSCSLHSYPTVKNLKFVHQSLNLPYKILFTVVLTRIENI